MFPAKVEAIKQTPEEKRESDARGLALGIMSLRKEGNDISARMKQLKEKFGDTKAAAVLEKVLKDGGSRESFEKEYKKAK